MESSSRPPPAGSDSGSRPGRWTSSRRGSPTGSRGSVAYLTLVGEFVKGVLTHGEAFWSFRSCNQTLPMTLGLPPVAASGRLSRNLGVERTEDPVASLRVNRTARRRRRATTNSQTVKRTDLMPIGLFDGHSRLCWERSTAGIHCCWPVRGRAHLGCERSRGGLGLGSVHTSLRSCRNRVRNDLQGPSIRITIQTTFTSGWTPLWLILFLALTLADFPVWQQLGIVGLLAVVFGCDTPGMPSVPGRGRFAVIRDRVWYVALVALGWMAFFACLVLAVQMLATIAD